MKTCIWLGGCALALVGAACGSTTAPPADAAAADTWAATDTSATPDTTPDTAQDATTDTAAPGPGAALVAQLDQPSLVLTATDEKPGFGDADLQDKALKLAPTGGGKAGAAEGVLDDPALALPLVQSLLGDKVVAVHLRLTLAAKNPSQGAAFTGVVATTAGVLIGHRALEVEAGDELVLDRKPGPDALAKLAFHGQLAAAGEEADRDSFVVVLLHAAKAAPVLTVQLGDSSVAVPATGQTTITRAETPAVTAMLLAQRRPEGPCTTARGLLFGQPASDNPAVSQLAGLVWQGGKATGYVKGLLGRGSNGATHLLLKGIDVQGKAAWHGRYDGPLTARVSGALTSPAGAPLGTFAVRLGLGDGHEAGPGAGRYSLILSTECESNGGQP
ncbi:MAG: hypothetical protein HY902_19650 [Deltaproteobacteria bacterium]|nr:hypothetical protein [Deltaproteobacteria bacterium]